MEKDAVKKLDLSLLKRTRVETTEQITLTPASDAVSESHDCAGNEVIEAEVEQINQLTSAFRNPHVPQSIQDQNLQEKTVSEILDKYNKKYNLDLKYGNFQDALNLAVEGDSIKSSLMNAVVGNSILSLVDFTNFSLIVLACKQINGMIAEMLEGDELGQEDKVILVDRIFLWINRLQAVKALYSPTDIEHIIKRLEQSKDRNRDSKSKVAINKILDILKLGKTEN